MGRKKGLEKALASRGSTDSGFEDASSTTSSAWTTAYENRDESETVDLFSQAVADLFEKRRETREKALQALVAFFREDVRVEDAMLNETTIVSRCIQALRRGGNIEAMLASQLLGLHLMTLPEQQEGHLREAQFDLLRAATAGETAAVRVAAIDALSMACFVSADDDTYCLEIMARLQGMWASESTKAGAAAVRGWTLLFTRLNAPLANGRLESALSELAQLLQARDVEARGAAGEALAVVLHCTRGAEGTLERLVEQEEYASYADQEEDEGEEADMDQAQVQGTDEVMGRMQKLAVAHHTADRSQRSRRDRAAMKATFRGVMALVEKGTVPQTKIKLQHGDTLIVDTCQGNVQLSAVRKFLAGGFQVHLQRNALLHALFNFTPAEERASRLTATEKRLLRSPSSADSKWRTHERKGDRAYKATRQATGVVYEEEA